MGVYLSHQDKNGGKRMTEEEARRLLELLTEEEKLILLSYLKEKTQT